MDGQHQVAVHDFEAARGFVGFEGADLALGEMRDERAGVGGRREDIHHGQFCAQFFRAAHAHQAAHQVDDQVGILFFERLERA